MTSNIMVKDATGASVTMKTSESAGVHTPVHRIDGYDPQDDMLKVKSVQKKFRDSFIGTAIDLTKWDAPVIGVGANATVASGVLTMSSGATANAVTSMLTKETFTVPFRVSLGLTLSQRIANQTFLVEAVSVDPITGVANEQNICALVFDGVSATAAKYRVQNGGATPLDSAASAFPTSAAGSVYEMEPFSDECWFHGGVLDSNAARSNSYRRHQQIPEPNAVYKLRLRWINGAVAPATSTNAVLQYLACQDYAELTAEITAGRGQTVAGQAIGVAVVSLPAVAQGAAGSATWLTKTPAVASVATALAVLNAIVPALDVSANYSAGMAITAIAAPVGIVLTPYVSFDGGVNWQTTYFDNPATGAKTATMSGADLVVGAARTIVLSGGVTHVRVQATGWTSGSVTVQTRGTQTMDPSTLNGGSLNSPTQPPVVTQMGGWDGAALRALKLNSMGYLSVMNMDNVFYNETIAVQAGSATFTGGSRDSAITSGSYGTFSSFNAFAFADQAGSMRIECSNDSTTWRRMTADTAVAANTPVILNVPVMTRYHRAVYVNGATPQTAFMLNTSYTAA